MSATHSKAHTQLERAGRQVRLGVESVGIGSRESFPTSPSTLRFGCCFPHKSQPCPAVSGLANDRRCMGCRGYVALAVSGPQGTYGREVETGAEEREVNMVRFAEEALKLLRDAIKGEAKEKL